MILQTTALNATQVPFPPEHEKKSLTRAGARDRLVRSREPAGPHRASLWRRLRPRENAATLLRGARACLALLAALAVLALAVPVQAQTDTTFISNSAQLISSVEAAQIRATAFTTGSNSGGYGLSSVDVYVGIQLGTVTPLVEIYVDNAGNPGTLHATLSNPATVTDSSANTFTATNTTLSATTTYWLVTSNSATISNAVNPGSGFAVSVISNRTADTGAATGWSIGNGRFKGGINQAAWTNSSNRILFTVKGTAVGGTPNAAPTVANAIDDQTATVGTALSYEFPANTFADTDAGDTLTYTATQSDDTELPSWLSFAPTTRTFSGTPAATDVETVSVKVTASDGTDSVSDTFDIVVSADTTTSMSGVLVSNVGKSAADAEGLVTTDLAQPFTTGDNADGYTLTGIELRLGPSSATSSTTAPTVKLFSGSANGTEVATLTGPANLARGVNENYEFRPSLTVTLDASTTYWVVAEGAVSWITTYETTEDATSASGWSIGDNKESRLASSTSGFTAETRNIPSMIRVNGAVAGTTPTNTAAMGAPTITGTAQVGETLTAVTTGITDADGLTGPTYTYQWIRVDGGTEADISGANSSTYTLDAADLGKTIKVKVSFTDDASNTETLTSAATATVTAGTTATCAGMCLVSNVGQTEIDGNVLSGTDAAQSFTTGDATGYTLTNIELRLTTSTSDFTTPTVKLFSGSANGTEEATLIGPAMLDTNTTKNYTFTPSSTVTLLGSTTYWVVAEGTSDAGGWPFTLSTSEDATSATGWEIGDARETRPASSTGGFTESTGTAFLLRVNGTPGSTTVTTSSDATLSALALENASDDSAITISPVFASGTTSYTASVLNGVDEITIEATVNESNATFEYLDDSDTAITDANSGKTGQQVSLDEDENTIKVKVTAQDATTTNTYTVVVTRAAANNAPVFADATASRSFTETVGDAAVSTAGNVGAVVTATDADSDTLTYSLEGTDAAKFGIVSGSGRIQTKVGEKYDREAKASYSVTVKADDSNGGSDTIAVTITVDNAEEKPLAPAMPTVTATSGSTTSLDVSWAAPANTGRPAITGYKVQYRAGVSGNWLTHPHTGTARTATIASLMAATAYQVQVLAVNSDGDGPFSGPGAGTTGTNTAATGAPTITGTAQVGETLTASTTGIADANGLTSPTYTYQWIRANGTETDIASANSSTYILVAADLGKTIKVKVSFEDDDSNAETLTSAATATVVAAPTAPMVTDVDVTSSPDSGDTYGTGEMILFTVTFDQAVTVTGTPEFEFCLGTTSTMSCDMGATPARRRAALSSGSGTTALVFGYTVVAGDVDDNGIWTGDQSRTIKLEGGTIQGTVGGLDAVLTHAEEGEHTGHKVNGATANTAPTAANNTVTTAEDRAYTFTAADFGFMDADAGAALASVKIVTVPAAGTLALDGTAVVALDDVTKAQIDGDMLTFRPALNAHGVAYTTFTFKVNDGTDDSASAYTMTIDVTDAPAPVCTAPSFGDRREIWTGTVTVELEESPGFVYYGFNEGVVGTLLPSQSFSIGSNNYVIAALVVDIPGSSVRMEFGLDGPRN